MKEAFDIAGRSRTFTLRAVFVVTAVVALGIWSVLGGVAPAVYLFGLLVLYVIADRYFPLKLLMGLAIASSIVAVSGCVAWDPGAWGLQLPRPATTPRVFVPIIATVVFLLVLCFLAGSMPLEIISQYAGSDIRNALCKRRHVRNEAVFAVWGGIAIIFTVSALMKRRRLTKTAVAR